MLTFIFTAFFASASPNLRTALAIAQNTPTKNELIAALKNGRTPVEQNEIDNYLKKHPISAPPKWSLHGSKLNANFAGQVVRIGIDPNDDKTFSINDHVFHLNPTNKVIPQLEQIEELAARKTAKLNLIPEAFAADFSLSTWLFHLFDHLFQSSEEENIHHLLDPIWKIAIMCSKPHAGPPVGDDSFIALELDLNSLKYQREETPERKQIMTATREALGCLKKLKESGHSLTIEEQGEARGLLKLVDPNVPLPKLESAPEITR